MNSRGPAGEALPGEGPARSSRGSPPRRAWKHGRGLGGFYTHAGLHGPGGKRLNGSAESANAVFLPSQGTVQLLGLWSGTGWARCGSCWGPRAAHHACRGDRDGPAPLAACFAAHGLT